MSFKKECSPTQMSCPPELLSLAKIHAMGVVPFFSFEGTVGDGLLEGNHKGTTCWEGTGTPILRHTQRLKVVKKLQEMQVPPCNF